MKFNVIRIQSYLTFPCIGLLILASMLFPAKAEEHNSYPKHIMGVIGGVTVGDNETRPIYGAEYELRVNNSLGIGASVERISNMATVGILALYAHPMENLRLSCGIGKEWADSHSEISHGETHIIPSHSETVYRVGFAYDIEVNENIAIAPTYNLDFIDDHNSSVFGLVLQTHF